MASYHRGAPGCLRGLESSSKIRERATLSICVTPEWAGTDAEEAEAEEVAAAVNGGGGGEEGVGEDDEVEEEVKEEEEAEEAEEEDAVPPSLVSGLRNEA